jgi:hypothetical protein
MEGKEWKPPTRNFEGVQFENLRKTLDARFNAVHDELSACYYGGKPFRNYGILTKEQFDKLHGLIFDLRDVAFDEENQKLPEDQKISEDKYNDVKDEAGNIVGKKTAEAKQRIARLKNEGLEIEI